MAQNTEKAEYWKRRISDWKKSKLSKKAFCKKHNLSHHSMGYWNTRLRKLAMVETKPSRFVEVVTEKKPQMQVSIKAPAGVVIEFDGESSLDSVVECAVILPERSHYGTEVLEIISDHDLREKLSLSDGDNVKVEVRVDEKL